MKELNELKVLTAKDTKKEKYSCEWIKLNMDLPSRGLSYPKNFSIEYKKYSFREIEFFNSEIIDYLEKEKIDFALSGIKTSFDPLDLSYYDFIFINILRKLKTWSKNYFNLSFVCPYCNEKNENIKTNLNLIEIKDISEEIKELPLITKINNENLEIGLLTLRDVLNLIEINEVNNPLYNFAALIKNKKLEDSYNLLNEISNGDDIDLVNYINSLMDMNKGIIEVKCNKCNKSIEAKVKDLTAIAEPFHESERSLRDRISFGKESDN